MSILRGLTATVAIAAGLLIACSDVAAPPVPGELMLVLETPNADDRAIFIRITGPDMTEARSANADYVIHARHAGATLNVAAFGNLVSGAVVRFPVPDVNRRREYTATIVEVGDDSNALRPSLQGYRATVE